MDFHNPCAHSILPFTGYNKHTGTTSLLKWQLPSGCHYSFQKLIMLLALQRSCMTSALSWKPLGFWPKLWYSTVLVGRGTEAKHGLIQLGWNALWKYMFLSDYWKSWVKPILSCETLKQSLKLLDFRDSRLNWFFACTRRACFIIYYYQIQLYKLVSGQHLALCIWDHSWVIHGIIQKISNSTHTLTDSGIWFHRNYMAI